MNFIRYQDTPLETRGINHRVGTFRYKQLGEGDPGTPGNYNLRMVWSQKDFFSPRHSHNFDQVRIQIEGTFRFDRDGTMKPGVVAYFPEGTAYGPQTSEDETIQLVMQIGGPSGSGYLSEAERIAAVQALASKGDFRDGRFYPHDDPDGRGSIDSFQAAWEEGFGRRMRYPKRRFERPIFMQPDAFAWTAHPSEPGVAERVLARFDARTVGTAQVRMIAGASHRLEANCSAFVYSGSGTIDGQDQPAIAYGARDVLHLGSAESARLTADVDTDLLIFIRPTFEQPADVGDVLLAASTEPNAMAE